MLIRGPIRLIGKGEEVTISSSSKDEELKGKLSPKPVIANKKDKSAMKKFLIFTITAFVLAVAIEPVYARSQTDKTDKFLNGLVKNGYNVQEGLVDYPDMATLGCQCTLPTAYAYNPSSPYGIFVLPPAPNQDSNIKNPYSEWYYEDGLYPEGYSWFVRQRPDEAIVYIGTTPPEMDYFSLIAYIYDRRHDGFTFPSCVNTDDEGYEHNRATPPSAVDRFPIYASLGDSINNMTIKVAGGKDAPFNEPVVVIIATDQEVEQKIRKTLLKAGFPNQIINTLAVSPSIVRLGVDDVSDTLNYAWRLHSESTTEVENYKASPGRIFRVSPVPAIPSSDIIPLETPNLRIRGTGTDEMNLLPALDALGEAIVAKYPGYDAEKIAIMPWPEGYHCIENEQSCLADNRDDAAFASAFNASTLNLLQGDTTLDPNTFYVAYGVNHRKTGKATYTSVTVVNWRDKVSPASFKNSDMIGSAKSYLDPQDPQIDPATADKLYAWKIARNCDDIDPPYCREIGVSPCTQGVGEGDPISFVFRAYLEPETQTGPAINEVIVDRVIKFTKTQP